jgi:hypothetical protein
VKIRLTGTYATPPDGAPETITVDIDTDEDVLTDELTDGIRTLIDHLARLPDPRHALEFEDTPQATGGVA